MSIEKILGKKIIAAKTYNSDKRRKKNFHAEYLLFDDEQTFIEIDDQDYYAFRNCDGNAKIFNIMENPEKWKTLMTEDCYVDADKKWY